MPTGETNGGKLVPQNNKKPMKELGGTGLQRASGYINEEFLTALKGKQGVRVYTEMSSNDPIVGSVMYAIEMFLRKVEWRVEPYGSEDKDIEQSDFVRDCMDDMSHTWADFIGECLSMLVYGWSYFEVVYKRRNGLTDAGETRSRYTDGLIGWRKFGIRSQDTLQRWEFDEDGGIKGLWQEAPPDYNLTFLPIEKCLLFRTVSRKNNPEGRSLLRNAYRPWYYKKRIEEVEGVGIERDLAGLPVVYMPSEYLSANATIEQQDMVQAMTSLVKNIRRDEQEGVLFPVAYDEEGNQMWRLELLSSGGSRSFDTSGIIERYDKRIAMTTLADFILLGQDAVGSYALSLSKTGMFQAALESLLDNIAEVLNRHALPRLFQMNGWDTERMPTISHERVQEPTLEDLSAFITSLAGAGVNLFPDLDVENHLRKMAGFPEKEQEESAEPWNANAVQDENITARTDVNVRSYGKPAGQQVDQQQAQEAAQDQQQGGDNEDAAWDW